MRNLLLITSDASLGQRVARLLPQEKYNLTISASLHQLTFPDRCVAVLVDQRDLHLIKLPPGMPALELTVTATRRLTAALFPVPTTGKKTRLPFPAALEQFLSQGHHTLATCPGGLDAAIAQAPIRKFTKKALVYAEGQHPHALYCIESGRVKVCTSNDEGKELTVDVLGEGDFFAYDALLEGSAATDSARCLEESAIAMLPKESFLQLLESDRSVAQYFIHLMAQNCRDREKQALVLAYSSLRQRVAAALLRLEHKFHHLPKMPFRLHISREDLAHYAGTATESLIRTLSEFRRERLIELRAGNIIILDLNGLRAI